MAEEEHRPGASPPGFEQGPIRPPSEARSLLVRLTRNCPWNQCEFCPVYKGAKFSRRGLEEVKSDVRAMAWWQERAVEESWRLGFGGRLDERSLPAVYQRNADNPCLASILMWQSGGGRTAFLQDANSLVLAADDLAEMIRFLRETFPGLTRVTSYARSRTVAQRSLEELTQIRQAGLDRLHLGLESGSDAVLKEVKKGATAADHVAAGQKAVAAGFELSEYVMPGLGGKKRWQEHALETAAALNAINPHFIRLRSLGLREGMPMFERLQSGEFEPLDDEAMARELRLLVENLSGIGSYLVSDHILNLLPEVEGRLPEDQGKILAVIDRFLALEPEDKLLYVAGRRLGLLEGLADLEAPDRVRAARGLLQRLRQMNPPDLAAAIRELAGRFI